MVLAAGTRIGPYELLSALGAGAMGEVYRARDTKLGREVALKVLPAAFANDPDRLARSAREARLLAALNHPHIATIHGVEESDGVRALVMELVEGPTLGERLKEARNTGLMGLPLPEALRISGQIAEALESAHEKGIIHRDLKPANIKLTPDGNVKVLDFGLAKAFSSEGAGGDSSVLLTITGTELHGAVIGTPAYMSPEQARGQAVDKRADIWAFGCVLYETLAGRRPFPGETISDTIAMILEREPTWDQLPADTPPAVRRLLRRCLDKDPKRRLRDIGDARLEIVDAQSGPQPDERVAPASAGLNRKLVWASALALLVLAASLAGSWILRPPSSAPEVRLEISTPPSSDASLAISPDGFKVIFTGRSGSRSQLWLRSLDSSEARPLPGTDGALFPFWSPDSRSIGFFADSKLKRMELEDGSVRTLASPVPSPLGGTWNTDDIILFSASPGQPILRLTADAGETSPATRFESLQHRGHAFPAFLPDGRHFLFFARGVAEASGVYVGQLGGLDTKRLIAADGPAAFSATGHLLFVRGGRLLAQAFDPDRLEVTGTPVPLVSQVIGGMTLSASAAGPIVYRTTAGDSGQRQLVWVDRSGQEAGKVVYPDTVALGPALSPDGRRVAVFRQTSGNNDIWEYDTASRAWDRITVDSGDDIYPLWSPDGHHIVFGSRRGEMDLYRKTLGTPPGSGEERLLSTPGAKFPMDLSRDGRFLLYDVLEKGGVDMWALPLDGSRTPREIVKTEFDDRLGQFSPDGNWIAYQSNRTGRFEIYIRRFPGPGRDVRVSAEGGAQVRWNPNGKELFYIAADDRLTAVPISFSADGQTAEPGRPEPLFATDVGSSAPNTNRQQYAVSPDGQSFVLNSALDTARTSPITVILNWKPPR